MGIGFGKIKNITIVGGGSAGWMSAATLSKVFPEKNITLVESPNISTVGVGESTIGQLRQWCALIGLKDREFIPHTDASIKLSIKFTDFSEKGEAFHYPFGQGDLTGNHALWNDWWFKKAANPKLSTSDFADCMSPQMALVNANKCTDRSIDGLPFTYSRDTAFHFDATKFGLWLRDYICIPNGVKHIKEEIVDIERNEDGIVSLNGKHKADLFIDCTGFRSRLLGDTMKEPFESYNNLLPNDSAWATRLKYKDKKKELVGYTNCTAYNNGWIWNIPLWSRLGTGYVFSSKFVDDETALKEFKKYLGPRSNEAEFRKINMRVGIHRRLWVKNVCAIGLAAGFIEPLESNGLYSVHEFLYHLCRALKKETLTQFDKDCFTAASKNRFKNFANFVALHYALSKRHDTPYWRANASKEWSSKLIDLIPAIPGGLEKIAYDKYFDFAWEEISGLHYICAGMNFAPTDIVSIQYENLQSETDMLLMGYKAIGDRLSMKKDIWAKNVKKVPSLYKFLQSIHDK